MKGVILFHPDALHKESFAIDVLVIKKYSKECKDIKKSLYRVKCEFVEKWIKKHPGYKYWGSEDLEHTLEYNNWVLSFINNLINNGFKPIFLTKEVSNGN